MTDRRTDLALRRKIDQLLGRVQAAREEIVERGLDAVQDTKDQDGNEDDVEASGRPLPARDGDKPDDAAA